MDWGTVVFAGCATVGCSTGHGGQVIIAHSNADGEVVSFTSYSHLSQISVLEGYEVDAWAPIGRAGRSGNANDPGIPGHTHVEIRTTRSPGRGLGGRRDPEPEIWRP